MNTNREIIATDLARAARIDAERNRNVVALAAALDRYRAEGAAELGGGGPERLHWSALAQHLIDHPPYHAYGRDAAVTDFRALCFEFPLSTPFGDVVADIGRAVETDNGGRSFSFTIPRGGSFVVNGAEYAPGEGDLVTGTTVHVEFVTSYDKRTAWGVSHSPSWGKALTPAARAKVAEWIEAEGAELVFTPARVAARRIYDTAVNANNARRARDDAHDAAIAADADWNRAAGIAHQSIADALAAIDGEEAAQ